MCALINRDALPQLQGQTKLTAEEGSTSAHIFKKEVSQAALSVWDEGLWGNTGKFEEHALTKQVLGWPEIHIKILSLKTNNNKFKKEEYLKLSKSY